LRRSKLTFQAWESALVLVGVRIYYKRKGGEGKGREGNKRIRREGGGRRKREMCECIL
jgi:hypothetical protein